MAADGLTGVKLTTSQVREITKDLDDIAKNIDELMGTFNNILGKVAGQSEGGVIDNLKETGRQLYDGGIELSKCCLNLGVKIGDYLNVMLTGDSELAQQLINQIQS